MLIEFFIYSLCSVNILIKTVSLSRLVISFILFCNQYEYRRGWKVISSLNFWSLRLLGDIAFTNHNSCITPSLPLKIIGESSTIQLWLMKCEVCCSLKTRACIIKHINVSLYFDSLQCWILGSCFWLIVDLKHHLNFT